jgi:host factor-I protein
MVNRKLFRPTLTDVKEQFPARPIQAVPAQGAQRKKPAPPEQTHAENFYYVKQMQSRTPVAVVLTDGEILRGSVEWYDRDCINSPVTAAPTCSFTSTASSTFTKKVTTQRRAARTDRTEATDQAGLTTRTNKNL